MIATYPHYPGAKVAGTSQAAADAMAEHAPTLRERVDALFDRGNWTADECATRLNVDRLAIRPRLSELRKMGRIEETSERRENTSGIKATVWTRRDSSTGLTQAELL